jgi:hypothetical protein
MALSRELGEDTMSRARHRDQAAAVAARHCSIASARKRRSVRREIRWRWRLKVLWTAARRERKC